MSTAPDGISAEDNRYIRSHFVTLEWLAERTRVSRATLLQWQSQGLFPQPTYVTQGGESWYARSYSPLVRRAISLKTDLKTLFWREYQRALEKLRYTSPADYRAELAKSWVGQSPEEAVTELEWRAFLAGDYGACLRVAWVPSILRKGKLMRTIEELVANPHGNAPGWKRRLRQNVESLDRLEMPFAACDRVRWGKPVSRDTHVGAIRQRFPQVFGPPHVKALRVERPRAPPESRVATC